VGDGVSYKKLEESGHPRTIDGEGADMSTHAKDTVSKLGCKAPEEREFKLAFSLAEIFRVNKQISLEPILLHSVSSFIRTGRGREKRKVCLSCNHSANTWGK
jgi:hypothetical protein